MSATGSPPWPEALDSNDPDSPLQKRISLLRSKLLWAVLGSREHEKKVRSILANPLNPDAVVALGNMVTKDPPVWPERFTGPMLDYLALSSRAADPEMTAAIASVFEGVFVCALDSDGGPHPHWWSYAVNAIERYGSVELLTPSFWKGCEMGVPRRVLVALADEDMLAKLKAFDVSGQVKVRHLRSSESAPRQIDTFATYAFRDFLQARSLRR